VDRLRADAERHGRQQRGGVQRSVARSATVLIMPGKTFEDAFAQRNTGAVFAWKPGEKTFQMLPGTELSANNGIETSPDDQEFYVASTTTKRIYAYARAKPGVVLRTAQLKEVGPTTCGGPPTAS
jgi:sugar lactone lactonase YvrE